jgi:hypothetical protein
MPEGIHVQSGQDSGCMFMATETHSSLLALYSQFIAQKDKNMLAKKITKKETKLSETQKIAQENPIATPERHTFVRRCKYLAFFILIHYCYDL